MREYVTTTGKQETFLDNSCFDGAYNLWFRSKTSLQDGAWSLEQKLFKLMYLLLVFHRTEPKTGFCGFFSWKVDNLYWFIRLKQSSFSKSNQIASHMSDNWATRSIETALYTAMGCPVSSLEANIFVGVLRKELWKLHPILHLFGNVMLINLCSD